MAKPVKICGAVNVAGTKDLRSQGQHVRITITLSDKLTFSPTFVHVKPGDVVTVTIVNPAGPMVDIPGLYAHTFTIDALGVDVTSNHGTTETVTFTVPAGPSVVFYCRPHADQGMKGAFYTT